MSDSRFNQVVDVIRRIHLEHCGATNHEEQTYLMAQQELLVDELAQVYVEDIRDRPAAPVTLVTLADDESRAVDGEPLDDDHDPCIWILLEEGERPLGMNSAALGLALAHRDGHGKELRLFSKGVGK